MQGERGDALLFLSCLLVVFCFLVVLIFRLWGFNRRGIFILDSYFVENTWRCFLPSLSHVNFQRQFYLLLLDGEQVQFLVVGVD